MYQVNFSGQSLVELEKFDKAQQLQMVNQISELAKKALQSSSEVPVFNRGGKKFYRLKVDTLRVYIEKMDESKILCHYILPQHTLSDFLFRSKFPVSEEQMIEQHSSFWKYLESLGKKEK